MYMVKYEKDAPYGWYQMWVHYFSEFSRYNLVDIIAKSIVTTNIL